MPKAFPREFRDDVVRVARRGDGPVAQIAKDFGISESCLHRWLQQADGYHDDTTIRSDLAAAGFTERVTVEALEHRSRASTADLPAIAYCQGTPLRNELEQRDRTRLHEATAHATKRLSERFGSTDLDSKIRGFAITAATP